MLAIVLFLTCVVYSLQLHPLFIPFQPHRPECQIESNANFEDIEKFMNGEIVEDNQELKCFIKCTMSKTGILTNSGEWDEDVLRNRILSRVNKELGDEIWEKCNGIKEDDICDTAYNTAKCVVEMLHK